MWEWVGICLPLCVQCLCETELGALVYSTWDRGWGSLVTRSYIVGCIKPQRKPHFVTGMESKWYLMPQ